MFKLHVVQAQFGDCLILEYGTPKKRRFILVDGGPPGNYNADVAPALDQIVGANGKLDLVVISHIDNDHIVGALELFAALESDAVSEREPRVKISGLWHNSFERSIDPTGDIAQRMQSLMMMAAMTKVSMPLAADAFYGVKEGNRLRLMAHKLGIPANKRFKDDAILVETAKPVRFGPLELRIAGPNRANLLSLRNDWLAWLEKAAAKMADRPSYAAMADSSIPNLSSIVLLAECNGKRVLLTGDARGDHIIDGLKVAKLSKNGKLHVDVLKVQHHGSDRNTTRTFFDTVTADTYVLSANGRNGNPDYATLKWIVESAHKDGRSIMLVVTNETDATKDLRKILDPSTYGYEVITLGSNAHSVPITLSD
jgi:Metallo-beta-lactamase superfamily